MNNNQDTVGRNNSVKNNLDDLKDGEGIILEKEKVAAYRDDQGKLHIYSAVCTHMGCTISWNPLEKSFDCPCHGSRFSAISGNVINGPANIQIQSKRPID
jgi:Rieske Fe-S protein